MDDDLIERIYDVGAEPSAPWSEVLADVAARCEARLAWLAEVDTRLAEPPLWAMSGASAELQRAIRTRFLDPQVNELMALGLQTPSGRLVSTQLAARRLDLPRTRVYQEAMVPFELEEMLVVNLERTPTGLRSLSVFRSARDGAFRAAEQARFLRLGRHLGRAARLRLRLDRTARDGWLSAAALDRLRFGVLVVDERLRVVLANGRARQLAALDDGLTIVDDRLRLEDAAVARRLRDLLAASAGGPPAPLRPAWSELELPRRSGRRPYVALLGRLPHRPNPAGPPRTVHVLFLSDPEDLPSPPEAVLGRLWHLTPAEAEVCLAVTRGRGLRDVADELGVSVNTVRTHLGRVLHKTGTSRQAELIRLVVSCLGAATFEPAATTPAGPPPGDLIRSDDGADADDE